MKQLAFFFEQRACTGCHTCRVACADAHDLGPDQDYRRVWEVQGGSWRREGAALVPELFAYWNTVACCHCRKPACLEVCPSGAISKRGEDGVVLIDSARCVSCRSCLEVCPYGAIALSPSTGRAEKCDFCVEELALGRPPTCVVACPMRALDWGDLEELRHRRGGAEGGPGFPDPSTTRPALLVLPRVCPPGEEVCPGGGGGGEA